MTFSERLKQLGHNSYDEYLESPHWKYIKGLYRQSSMPQTCIACNKTKYDLHHRTYKRLGCEWKSDLVPLCRKCHEKIHRYQNKARQKKRRVIDLWRTDKILIDVFQICSYKVKYLFKQFEIYEPWITPHQFPNVEATYDTSIDDQLDRLLQVCINDQPGEIHIEDARIIKMLNERNEQIEPIRDLAMRKGFKLILQKVRINPEPKPQCIDELQPSKNKPKIRTKIKKVNSMTDNNLQIVIPMAGGGARFAQAGYALPKPLIEVFNNVPMIEVVLKSLEGIANDYNYRFVIQREHQEKFGLADRLRALKPGCVIKMLDGLTDGAARTVLSAKDYFNPLAPVLLVNSDQFITLNWKDFFSKNKKIGADHSILTFGADHPKWSYAKVDSDNWVTEVVEKSVVSQHATCGLYYFRRSSDLIWGIEEMIRKDFRVASELYVAPSINYLIQRGDRVSIYNVDSMSGLGVPDDLTTFQNKMKYEDIF